MATIEEVKVLAPVQDLKEGDVIDLAKDQYVKDSFDGEEELGDFENEYAVVQLVETYYSHSCKVTAVEFLHDGLESVVVFPLNYLISVVTSD